MIEAAKYYESQALGLGMNYLSEVERSIAAIAESPLMCVPVEKEEVAFSPRPYAEAWADIEQALEDSAPYYADWQEALRESRRQK